MKRKSLPREVRNELENFLEHHANQINKNGPEWAMLCTDPLCSSYKKNKLKLYINVHHGTGICFRCDTRYSLLDIVREFELCSWEKARKILLDWEGIVVPKDGVLSVLRGSHTSAIDSERSEPPLDVDLPSEFVPVTSYNCPSYILTRMTLKKALQYRVGFCENGYYGNRMIVPVFMPDGIRGFVARIMVKKPRTTQKVWYPKGMKTSKCLFNYPNGRHRKRIVLVEGVFDAIYGGTYYMAMFGKKISRVQVRLIQQCKARDIIVMLDEDARSDAFRISRHLSRVTEATVRVAYTERDPDEYERAELRGLEDQARSPGIASYISS